MSIKWKEAIISIMVGGIVTLVGVVLIGYTSAIAMPNWFSPMILIWELFVVQFVGIGIISMLAAFYLSKVQKFNPNFVVVALLVSVISFSTFYQGGKFYFYWPHLLVLVLSLVAGSRLRFKIA